MNRQAVSRSRRRRRGGARPCSARRAGVRAGARPRSASATCTRSRSTARCGSRDHLGAWAKHGLEPEFMQFTTGLELFQAMVGGSIDMLSTGAVISNFPARGQGKMFLVNCVEFATAQLWVRDGPGREGLRRPEGQAHRHDHRHDRARLPRQRAARQRARPGEGRRDRQPAHGRGRDLVHLRRGPRGGAVGAVQHHGARQGAGARRSWSTPRPTTRRPRSSRVGRPRTSFTRRTATCSRASIRAWADGNDIWSASPTRRSRSCRRSTTSRCRCRPQGAVRRAEGVPDAGVAQACTRTARSPAGCSR